MKITRTDNTIVETRTKTTLETILQCGSRSVSITTTETENRDGIFEYESEIYDNIFIKKSGTCELNGRTEFLCQGDTATIHFSIIHTAFGINVSGWLKNSYTRNAHRILVETAERFFEEFGDETTEGIFVEIEFKPTKKRR